LPAGKGEGKRKRISLRRKGKEPTRSVGTRRKVEDLHGKGGKEKIV